MKSHHEGSSGYVTVLEINNSFEDSGCQEDYHQTVSPRENPVVQEQPSSRTTSASGRGRGRKASTSDNVALTSVSTDGTVTVQVPISFQLSYAGELQAQVDKVKNQRGGCSFFFRGGVSIFPLRGVTPPPLNPKIFSPAPLVSS